MTVGDILVKDFAGYQLPGDIQLSTKIDNEVSPYLPGPDNHKDTGKKNHK